MRRPATLLGLAAALLLPAGASANATVCARGCDFTTIQRAVDRAGAGDTVRVRDGVYRESVKIAGAAKRNLRLLGNPRHPERVVLRARGAMQNGVVVNRADNVTVDGFLARDYRANGFLFLEVAGYTMNHLIARRTGVYGLYAYESTGGRMLNSEASGVSDSGFYIGETPPQDTPSPTLVSNVSGWGSPLGFSGTNLRYVTITRSRFYNNGTGIVLNASDAGEHPPPEHNTITGNDVFWNNLNFYRGRAPFTIRRTGTAAFVPLGTGILMGGGRDNRIERNRIHGNFLAGLALVDGIFAQGKPEARAPLRNVIADNAFGLGGSDVNGVDLVYDGSGADNCFSLAGAPRTFPADGATFAGCVGANAFDAAVQSTVIGWVGENALAHWNRHPHPPKPGFTPLERFS